MVLIKHPDGVKPNDSGMINTVMYGYALKRNRWR